jgi:FkbM family methyltransferase
VVDRLVSRGALVLDIGAMRGSFAARMLDLVGRSGQVHAFEPNPAHHDHLRTFPGQGAQMILHPVALSDHSGTAVLHVPSGGGLVSAGLASLESRGAFAAHNVEVPVRRLADEVTTPRPIGFVKCDVEGHEDSVIEGGRSLLERDLPPLLIEIEQRHRGQDPGLAFSTLEGMGYEGWALFPSGLRPLADFDLERDQLRWLEQDWPDGIAPAGYVHNFLFVRPRSDLSGLLDPARVPARAAQLL